MHYYEISIRGTVIAYKSLEEAIEAADNLGADMISEIGGAWNDYERCAFCGDWFTSEEINAAGDCRRCEVAIRDHNGLW